MNDKPKCGCECTRNEGMYDDDCLFPEAVKLLEETIEPFTTMEASVDYLSRVSAYLKKVGVR